MRFQLMFALGISSATSTQRTRHRHAVALLMVGAVMIDMFTVGSGPALAQSAAAAPSSPSSAGAQRQSKSPSRVEPSAYVPGLDDNRVQIIVASQDLTKTLEVLSEQTQLKFVAAKGLKGTTSRLRIDGSGRTALDAVANQVGAVWWWNGSEVRLAPRSDTVSRSIKARDIDLALDTARGVGLPVELLTISKPSIGQTVRISGPTALVSDFETINDEISGRLSTVSLTKFGRRRVVKLE
jgi:hypothetical protein